eukprot:9520934-Prorocentrum_lima.AAC.1
MAPCPPQPSRHAAPALPPAPQHARRQCTPPRPSTRPTRQAPVPDKARAHMAAPQRPDPTQPGGHRASF